MFKLDLQKAEVLWIIRKARGFQKIIYFCFIDYTKTSDYVDHNKLWKILQEMGILDHFTCILRNLYAGQEATVRTRHATTNWFKIGRGVHQSWISSPCLFNFYAEHIMWNSELDEAQTGIKITRRIINNLRYADYTTLMTENEEELKSLLMKVQEESEKASLKLNIQKYDHGIWSHCFMANRRGKVESDRFYFLGLQSHCGQWM